MPTSSGWPGDAWASTWRARRCPIGSRPTPTAPSKAAPAGPRPCSSTAGGTWPATTRRPWARPWPPPARSDEDGDLSLPASAHARLRRCDSRDGYAIDLRASAQGQAGPWRSPEARERPGRVGVPGSPHPGIAALCHARGDPQGARPRRRDRRPLLQPLLHGQRRAVSTPRTQRLPEPSTLRRRPAGVAGGRLSAGRDDGGTPERRTQELSSLDATATPGTTTTRSPARWSPARTGAGAWLTRSASSSTPATAHQEVPRHDPNRRRHRATRAARASAGGLGADQDDLAPVGPDRRQGQARHHRAPQPLVARAPVPGRAWPDHPPAAP